MDNKDELEMQQHYQVMRKTVSFINGIIKTIKDNIYNYLNDKRHNKLDSSIDFLVQDKDDFQRQNFIFKLFKRTVYYFDNIQFDLRDEFWEKSRRILTIDLTQLDFIEKAKIYKNLLHLILEYQIRVQQQQKKLYQQKKQAERIKRILKQKQIRKKEKEQQELKKEQEQKQKEQQLIENYDKMAQIVEKEFQEHLQQLNKAKTKVVYGISKQRRLQKKHQNYKKKKFSSYNPHVHTPKKPRKPKKY